MDVYFILNSYNFISRDGPQTTAKAGVLRGVN